MEDYTVLPKDFASFVSYVRAQHAFAASLPTFLFGHSMGASCVTLAANSIQDVSGLAFTAVPIDLGPTAGSPMGRVPLFHPFTGVPLDLPIPGSCLEAFGTDLASTRAAMEFARILGEVDPNGPSTAVDFLGLTTEMSVLADVAKDPRHHKGCLANKTADELFKFYSAVKAEIPNIALPVLLMHGAEDTLGMPAGSKYYFANCATAAKNKHLELLPGLKHELLFESKETVATNIAKIDQFFKSLM